MQEGDSKNDKNHAKRHSNCKEEADTRVVIEDMVKLKLCTVEAEVTLISAWALEQYA